MSLGQWFRDYVYIPLGGNRVRPLLWVRNVLVVWLLTGFWHGADWTFILWGLYFALFLLLERFFLARLLERLPRPLTHLYVCLIIAVSFVLFSADGLGGAVRDIGALFGAGGLPLWSPQTGYYLSNYAPVLLVALIGCTPIPKMAIRKLSAWRIGKRAMSVLEPVFNVLLLVITTAYFVDGSFSAFLYFRF
jgi:alginate O-acetyltransferase complex protein AlgI